MGLTVALADEDGVVRSPFVYLGTVKICQPGLDVPGRDEDTNPLVPSALFNADTAACAVEFTETRTNSAIVTIDHDHERLIDMPAAVCLQLCREVPPYELFCRAPLHWRFHNTDASI